MEFQSCLCNKCGTKIKRGSEFQEGLPDFAEEEHITIKKEFGYFSRLFDDGDYHEIHLCEQCYLEFINSFKLPPKKKNYFDCEEI